MCQVIDQQRILYHIVFVVTEHIAFPIICDGSQFDSQGILYKKRLNLASDIFYSYI
jgi:hypothetical protein